PTHVNAAGLRILTQRYQPRAPRVLHAHELTPEFCEAWIKRSISTWHKITGTQVFQRERKKYTFQTHCLVLWQLATEVGGYRCPAFTIDFCPKMHAGMPKSPELKAMKLECTTDHKNLFKNAAQERTSNADDSPPPPQIETT